MSTTDVATLGISKNLLQMNFMRRTLLAQEKANAIPTSDLLPNSNEYVFKLPPTIEKHLKVVSNMRSLRTPLHFQRSIFKVYGVAPGFRESFGGFNSAAQVTDLSKTDQATNPLANFHTDPDNFPGKKLTGSGGRVAKHSDRFFRKSLPSSTAPEKSKARKRKSMV